MYATAISKPVNRVPASLRGVKRWIAGFCNFIYRELVRSAEEKDEMNFTVISIPDRTPEKEEKIRQKYVSLVEKHPDHIFIFTNSEVQVYTQQVRLKANEHAKLVTVSVQEMQLPPTSMYGRQSSSVSQKSAAILSQAQKDFEPLMKRYPDWDFAFCDASDEYLCSFSVHMSGDNACGI